MIHALKHYAAVDPLGRDDHYQHFRVDEPKDARMERVAAGLLLAVYGLRRAPQREPHGAAAGHSATETTRV